MAKVIACVGAHKTASSLLQHHFKWRRGHYIAQGLDNMERDEVKDVVGHRGITKHPEKLTEAISQSLQKTGGTKMFLCYEDMFGKPFSKDGMLYGGGEKSVPVLAEALRPYEARIVYTIRPQWDFIQSFYLQKVHEGYYKTFSQFMESIDIKKISWRPIVNLLHDEFGEENVDVIDFKTIKKGQEAFIDNILQRCVEPGMELGEVDPKVHNPSISDRGLHIALRINPLLKPGWDEVGKVRKFLQNNFSNLNEPRPHLLTDAMKDELMELYADEYVRLVA